jgi:hypothetical protein
MVGKSLLKHFEDGKVVNLEDLEFTIDLIKRWKMSSS